MGIYYYKNHTINKELFGNYHDIWDWFCPWTEWYEVFDRDGMEHSVTKLWPEFPPIKPAHIK